MDRKRLLDELKQNTRELGARFELPEAQLERSYAPGKWTVRQLLAHLADSEFINLGRFCMAVAEPGSVVAPFSENRWASELGYDRRPRESAAQLFLGARQTLQHYVQTLPEELLSRSCVHPEKGPLDGWSWVELAIGHAAHHMSQIDAAASGEAWVKPAIANASRFGA